MPRMLKKISDTYSARALPLPYLPVYVTYPHLRFLHLLYRGLLYCHLLNRHLFPLYLVEEA